MFRYGKYIGRKYLISEDIAADWPYSHQRRIIRLRWVIRWIISVRQIVRLDMKRERSCFWMDSPPDFIDPHVLP